MRVLTIQGPNSFFSYEDEKRFFGWLEEIPAVKYVTGGTNGLAITIDDPIDDESLRELIAIYARYHLDMRALAVFCNENNEEWFKNKSKFWFSSTFDAF